MLWLDDAVTSPDALLSQSFLRELQRRMFADVWSWAGQLRQRDTTIGVRPAHIQKQLQALLGDVAYCIEHGMDDRTETCVRFHHRLVFIHPFVNGNGRHGRLAAGSLAAVLGCDDLTWGARRRPPSGRGSPGVLDGASRGRPR